MLEQIVPPELIDAMHAAFLPLLDDVVSRDPGPVSVYTEETGDPHTGMGKMQQAGTGGAADGGHRYTLTIPWVLPFTHRLLYENPVVLALLDRYWGATNFHITNYHSNNPRPGAATQHWHRDTNIASDAGVPFHSLDTCPCLGVKFPLVDTSEQNGSIEVLPCTQYLADPRLEGHYDAILSRGDFRPRRLNLRKGDCWIQDIRTLHRGTANMSSSVRPEVVINYTRDWWSIGNRITGANRVPSMTHEDFEALQLSERGLQLLGWLARPLEPRL